MKENNILDEFSESKSEENLLKRERKIFSISSLFLTLYNSMIFSAFPENLNFRNFISNAVILVFLSGITGYLSGLLIALIPYKKIPYKTKYIPASLLSIAILNLIAGIALTISAV